MGTTKETIDTVRGELESGGEIRPLDILKGKDGKEYPRSSYISDDIKQGEVEREEAAEIGEEQLESQIVVPTLGIYQLNKAHQVDCIEGLAGLRRIWERREIQFLRYVKNLKQLRISELLVSPRRTWVNYLR